MTQLFCLNYRMLHNHKEIMFLVKCLSPKQYGLWAVKIMDTFEAGELKDQRLSKKQLMAKPEFKQQNLQPVQSLLPAFQVRMCRYCPFIL